METGEGGRSTPTSMQPTAGPSASAAPQERCHFPSVCGTWARQTCRLTALAARGFFGQFTNTHTHSQAMFYSAIKPCDAETAGDGITQEELIKGFV